MHDEAMRCDGRCRGAMDDAAILCTMGRCYGAMRCTVRRCDERWGDAMGRCNAR